MNGALWLLLWLQVYGRVRRLGRGLRTVRGVAFAIVGIGVLALWLLPSLLTSQVPTAEDLAGVRRLGPLMLLGICLMNVLLSSAEGGVTFTAAETTFLFPAPFSRRELLEYKIAGNVGAALLSALFITVFVRRFAALTLAAFLAVVMILTFIQLLGMALALLANTIGAAAYNRRRRLIVGALIVLAGVVLWQLGGDWQNRSWREVIDELTQNPVVRVLLAPVRCFIEMLTAETVWPDLAVWTLLSALVNFILAAIILGLDAQYLESSALASEKLYARLQRMRQGGTAMALPTGKTRLTCPPLPRWGGLGPLAWRQLTTALRSLKSLVLMGIFFVIFLMPMFLQASAETNTAALPGMLIGMLVATTLIVPPMIPFDFRGDLDRLPFLKTLPLPAWRIAVGQVLAPVVVLTLAQVIMLSVIQVIGSLHSELWLIGVFLVPINFLIFTVENLFFLLFPIRQAASSPGDFQLLGRNLIIWLAKVMSIGVAALPATLAGLIVFMLSGESRMLALSVAWFVLAAVVAFIIPLLAWAFARFDVARDMPAE